VQGQLFTQDFLEQGITETEQWRGVDEGAFKEFAGRLRNAYSGFTGITDPNEATTERQLIDAVHLYGIGKDDAAYILDTFPIVKREDEEAFGRYLTKDLILAYMNAVAAGDMDTVVLA